MALSQTKQMDILNKVREVEGILEKKFKAPKDGTFGSKIKKVQDKIDNQFFVNSVWTMVQIRNAMIHPGDFELSIKEHKLFKTNYDYIKSVLTSTKLKVEEKRTRKKTAVTSSKKDETVKQKRTTSKRRPTGVSSSSSSKKSSTKK